MSREVFEIVKGMDLRNIETQMALQCAPLITGLKLSNLLIVQKDNALYVREILKNTGISFRILCTTEEKTIFLLYNESKLREFLSEDPVRFLLEELGYEEYDLEHMFTIFQSRYETYMRGGGSFPHEMGLFLGYPVEDVKGFIEHKGKHFLYTGYWKVYENMPEKIKLFRKFEQAKETLIQLISCGISIRTVIDIYDEDTQKQEAV